MAFGEVRLAVRADFFTFAGFVVVQRFAGTVDAGGDVDPFRALGRTGNQAVAGRWEIETPLGSVIVTFFSSGVASSSKPSVWELFRLKL